MTESADARAQQLARQLIEADAALQSFLAENKIGAVFDAAGGSILLREAQERIRANEQRLRDFAHHTPFAVAMFDTEMRYLAASRRWLIEHGVDGQDVVGRSHYEIFPGAEQWKERHARGLAGIASACEEDSYIRDGALVWISWAVSPWYSSRGEIGGIIISVDMINERKAAQLALQRSEAKYRGLIETTHEGVLMRDTNCVITFVNRRMAEMLGYTVDEMVGMTFYDLVDVAARAEFEAKLARRNQGISDHYDLRFRRKDGSAVWSIASVAPILDDQGAVVGGFGMFADVTERKRAEDSLRQQLARVTLLNEISHAVAGRHDLHSIFHVVLRHLVDEFSVDVAVFYECDPKAATVTVAASGTKAREEGATRAFPEGAVVPIEETGIAVCLTGRSVYLSDVLEGAHAMVSHSSGRDIRSLVGVPLVVEGSVLGVLVAKRRTVDGFTEDDRRFLETLAGHTALAVHQARLHRDLKAAYDTLQRTQQQVVQQERLRALGQMASGIAHDFNNALSPILGFTDILLAKPKELANEDTTRHYLKMMHTAAKDGARVVSRLKEFYRHREETEVFQPVDLNRLVEETVSLTEPRWKGQAQAKGSDIQVVSDLGPITPFPGNESDLRELLTNLIFNAVDAMPGGGKIVLRTRADRTHTTLEVADTGSGMTEEVQRRCLEPFFTTKGDSGTGLGLAMVHGIVRRHDGSVEIESEVGKGTTFRLRFPVKVAPQSSRDGGRLRETTAPTLQLSVLVVDDNSHVRELLTAFLALDEHRAEVAVDGKDGLAKFVSGQFDVLITDRAMPRMSGDQLAAAVKAFSPSAKVILLTGFGEFMEAAGERPAGVDLILSKPVTLSTLRQALAKVSH